MKFLFLFCIVALPAQTASLTVHTEVTENRPSPFRKEDPRNPKIRRKILVHGYGHPTNDEGDDETLSLYDEKRTEEFTGAGYVRELVKRSLRNATKSLDTHFKNTTVHKKQLMTEFVIGLVRHPLDFYLSMWSQNSNGHGNLLYALSREERNATLAKPVQHWNNQAKLFDDVSEELQDGKPKKKHQHQPQKPAKEIPQQTFHGDADSEVQQFRKWVRLVNNEHMGVLTTRFFWHYMKPENMIGQTEALRENPTPNGPKRDINRMTSAQLVRNYPPIWNEADYSFKRFKSLQHFNKICWVKQDSLVSDTKGCLQSWETQFAQHMPNYEAGSKLDLEAFDHWVEHSDHKAVKHLKCSKFYDQATIDFVAKADHNLFDRFEFSKSCEQ